MHFYSETYESLMRMPLKAFWLLSNNVDRIQAQLDLRTLQLNLRTGMGASSESINQLSEILIAETGEIVRVSPNAQLHAKRDEQGFAMLKKMAQGK